MTKTTGGRRRKTLIVCIAISLWFIWLHSMIPREQSHAESSFVLQAVNSVIGRIFGFTITEHIVRKAAHFTEYAVLGSELTLLALWDQKRWKALFVFGAGLLTACLDETIQLFSGRGSQVSDVVLDVSGVMVACVAVFTVNCLRNHLFERHRQ